MALTPIVPAVSRTNNIDSMLVFTLLLATWMLFRAVRTAKFGWVLAAFAMIGVDLTYEMLKHTWFYQHFMFSMYGNQNHLEKEKLYF